MKLNSQNSLLNFKSLRNTLIILSFCLNITGQENNLKNQGPYKDDPVIIEKIKNIPSNSAILLGNIKVEPADVAKYHPVLKGGPGRRDYGNKVVYAPDKGVALYCGANHGSPHRLTDVWEFHLGSNTWRMICQPGIDYTRVRAIQNDENKISKEIAANKDVEANKKLLEEVHKKMAAINEGITVKDGYLQDKANGGPVQPWHTWDGLTYDFKSKKLYWAVLDSDNFKDEKNQVHRNLTKAYAKYTGQNETELLAKLKPGSSMYIYDLEVGLWRKQLGEAPFPIMRGMGGTLHYIPDLDVTIWYACVGNTPSGYDEGMWAYDAKNNTWKNLISGSEISGLMRTKKAPGEELQVAYNTKHKKLIAVQKEMTFVYDIKSNTWARVADNLGYGMDSHSVFVYDKISDACLLLSKKGGQWSKEPWQITAYDVANDKWEVAEIKGDQIIQGDPEKGWLAPQYTGYYDETHNVFAIYNGRNNTTWLYRHKAKE